MKLYKFIGSVLEVFFKSIESKEYPTLEEQTEVRRKVLLGRLRAITHNTIPDDFEITNDIKQKLFKYLRSTDDVHILLLELCKMTTP